MNFQNFIFTIKTAELFKAIFGNLNKIDFNVNLNYFLDTMNSFCKFLIKQFTTMFFWKALPKVESKEVMRMLKLLQMAYKEISKDSKDKTTVLGENQSLYSHSWINKF